MLNKFISRFIDGFCNLFFLLISKHLCDNLTLPQRDRLDLYGMALFTSHPNPKHFLFHHIKSLDACMEY
jgi:hypothetical protein